MKNLFKGVLLTLSVAACVNASAQVVVYKTNNFTGDKLEITQDWKTGGKEAWNDVIQSIKVPSGWKIGVYEHGFSGRSFELTKDWNGPSQFGISSIKIIEKSSPKVTLYKTKDFTGESMEITDSWRTGGGMPWNDVIQSIKVPAGWKIVVYEHGGFGGRSFEATKDWTGPAPFGISSVKIVEKQ